MIKGNTILEVIYDYGICKRFNIAILARIINVINDEKLTTLSLDLNYLYHEQMNIYALRAAQICVRPFRAFGFTKFIFASQQRY